MGKFAAIPEPLKTWARRHLFNVVKEIDFGLVAVKSDQPLPHNVNAQQMLQEYIEYCAARVGHSR